VPICGDIVFVLNVIYDVKRLLSSKHAVNVARKAKELVSNFKKQQRVFTSQDKVQKTATRANSFDGI
jgi:hypothetical protein